jgi:hypothetical protein
MIRRIPLLILPFLAAAAFAHPSADLAPLSQADAELRTVLSLTRAANVAAPAVSAAAGVASLRCRAANGDRYYGVEGVIDLKTKVLTSALFGKSPLLDASKGAKLVDERCGATAAPIASSDNYYTTAPHNWGEDILQLPKGFLPAAGTGSFNANLHACQYDGDWSSSRDVAMKCEIAVQ